MNRRGGIKIFCPKVSVSLPTNFVGEHFGVSGNFGYRKNLCIGEGGGISFPRRKLFVTQYRKISLGNTSVYREFSGIEKFCASEREGVSHFSVENFLSHSTKKFRWGTLRCIRKIRVSKEFMHQRGRGYQFSPSKTVCHTVSKIFVGEHSGVSGNFGYRKTLCIREGGSITFLRRKLFVTQYQKISLGNTSVYQKNSGIEKFYASQRGGYHISQSKTFFHTVPKIVFGEHFVESGILGFEKFYASEREGVSPFSVVKFLSHSTKKFRWGTLRCIRKFRISKQIMHRRERERERDYHVFPSKICCLTVPIKFVGEHFCVSKDF